MTPNYRAVRYRQLSLAEADRAKADLLLKLADEADREVLCTSDRLRETPSVRAEPTSNNLAQAFSIAPAFSKHAKADEAFRARSSQGSPYASIRKFQGDEKAPKKFAKKKKANR